MDFRVCLKCNDASWFDISFTFFRIGEKQLNNFPEECKEFNIEKGDVLVGFKPEIHCNCISEKYSFNLFDVDWMLNRFYFKNPEFIKFALMKKSFIKKNKIKINDLYDVSASMFFKKNEGKFYYICDIEPYQFRDFLLSYMKFIEEKIFPTEDCQYSFEHVVLWGEK